MYKALRAIEGEGKMVSIGYISNLHNLNRVSLVAWKESSMQRPGTVGRQGISNVTLLIIDCKSNRGVSSSLATWLCAFLSAERVDT